ncbi:MAG: RNA polymerase sigma factor [Planctomycetota bacterium]
MTESSEAIERRFPERDAAAFEAAYRRYRGLVHAVAVLELKDPTQAEDVTQEVFRRAFAAADQLAQPERLKAWLLSIARHYIADARKRACHIEEPLTLQHHAIADAGAHADPTREVLDDEWARLVRRAILELPENYREIVALRLLEDMPYREIADVLAVSLATVKNAVARGGRILLERLRRERGGEQPLA